MEPRGETDQRHGRQREGESSSTFWPIELPVTPSESGSREHRRWKAPWSEEAAVFDEPAAEAGLAMFILVRRSSGPAGRGRRATEGVRGPVANSIGGRKRRDRGALSGGSVDRSPHQDRTALGPRLVVCRSGFRLRAARASAPCAKGTEARGSPSSEAPLESSAGGSGPRRIVPNRVAARRGGGALENQADRRVLVSEVGCRDR